MQAKALSRRDAEEGVCQVDSVDPVKVSAALKAMPPADAIERVAELFHILSDPTRLRILHALARAEFCVCDLAQIANRSMGATSHQLQQLRRLRLVTYRMAGKLAYYKLSDTLLPKLLDQAVNATKARAA